MQITLDQLLEARDQRYARQLALTKAWPDRTLVCLTVVLPGSVKRDARSLRVADAAVAAVRERLAPVHEALYDLETGYEGYFLIDAPLLDVKRICCAIENEHPYGRLMDLDVLEPVTDPLGAPASTPAPGAAPSAVASAAPVAVIPVSRDRVGEQPRRCLLCDRPARECMRAHTHTPAEISAAIDRLLGL